MLFTGYVRAAEKVSARVLRQSGKSADDFFGGLHQLDQYAFAANG